MNRRVAVVTTAGVIALMAALAIWAAPRMPDRVPIHWNIRGEADGFASPMAALAMTPLVTAGLAVLLWFLPRIDPRGENLAASRAYAAVWIGIVAFLLVVHAVIVVAGATDVAVPVLSIVPAAIGVLFVVLGLAMPRIASNWFMGIRTPWTLTSELSWQRTHRVGGVMFLVLGLVLVGASVIAPAAAAVIAGAGAIVIVVVTSAYSYVVWRGDPDRADRTKPA